MNIKSFSQIEDLAKRELALMLWDVTFNSVMVFNESEPEIKAPMNSNILVTLTVTLHANSVWRQHAAVLSGMIQVVSRAIKLLLDFAEANPKLSKGNQDSASGALYVSAMYTYLAMLDVFLSRKEVSLVTQEVLLLSGVVK